MDESSFEQLRRQTDHQRRNFIETDIDLAMTFVQLAQTELEIGDRQHASKLLLDAKHAQDTIAKFLGMVADPKEQRRLTDRFQALGRAIKELEVLLRQPNGST